MSSFDVAAGSERQLPEFVQNPTGTMPTGLPLRALPLFVFLHVPKTAGTSARQMFLWMLGDFYFAYDATQHQVGPHDQAVWERPGFFDRYLMLGGHIGYRFQLLSWARRTGRRLVFVTCLREPVSRAVSFYDFVRRRPSHPLYPELRSRSLCDALDVPAVREQHLANAQLTQIFGSPAPQVVDRALATENYVIGRQDRFETFLDAVSAVMGIPRMATIPRENTAEEPGASQIEPASAQPDFPRALERIAEINQAESEFIERRIPDVLITTAPRLRFI
jgi:hypothetical protein